MRKILLSCVFCFCGFSFANAACTPPATLKCECQHPIIENGQLVCGPSYCAENTNCMPNGSCCPTANYCNSTEQGKQCCEEGQTCDTTKGCVEEMMPEVCAGVFETNGISFCMSTDWMSRAKALTWCSDNGMTLASMNDICPSWDGTYGFDKCPKLAESDSGFYTWVWTSNNCSNNVVSMHLGSGYVECAPDYDGENGAHAFCKFNR